MSVAWLQVCGKFVKYKWSYLSCLTNPLVQHPSRELLFFNAFSMYMTVKIRPSSPRCEASKSQHTDPVGFLRTSDQLVAEDATYITHNKHNGRLSVSSAGFQPAIPAIKRLQTFASYCTATGLESSYVYLPVIIWLRKYKNSIGIPPALEEINNNNNNNNNNTTKLRTSKHCRLFRRLLFCRRMISGFYSHQT
jgi:hypothetical protein